MLARLQQVTTLGLLCLALIWLVHFTRKGLIGFALGGALLIVFAYAIFLALEFTILWFVSRGDITPRATVGELARAWCGEVLAAPEVFCWRQPFRSRAEPDNLPAMSRQPGVVLVHGFVCNRAFWNPMMRRLRGLGVPFVAVNLEPIFGSIDRYTHLIEAAAQKVEEATGEPPLVVAHSMGGLAVRAWLARYPRDARVRQVVTVGSPHRGTYLGRFGFAPNMRQMRLASTWLQRLAAAEPAERYQRFTCFYGHCDNVVFPASTATLPGADNRHLPGIAHVHMAAHEEVFSEVLRWVELGRDGMPFARPCGPTTTR